ncbi:hypothetical protein M2140_000107 [Clostridiales Family XIII bacterium PM5-7]
MNTRKYPVRLKIVKAHGFKYHERELPKGAIYGQDEKGVFYCMDYKVKGKNGYYKGRPRLAIYRPVVSDPTKSGGHANWTPWQKCIEASKTSDCILNMYYEHEEECQVSWGDLAHKIAKKGDLRPAFGEVKYEARKYQANHYPKSTIEIVVGHRTLEQIADEQRGKYIY